MIARTARNRAKDFPSATANFSFEREKQIATAKFSFEQENVI